MAGHKNIPYSGIFEGMDFPDYQYEHYPLMMKKFDEKGAEIESRIVDDASEEAAAESLGFQKPAKLGPPVTLAQSELDAKDKEIAELKAQLAASKTVKAPTPTPSKV